MTRIWGICAKTEGGVFMYCSKPSGDHHPKNVMSQGGALLEAAAVAAPMRNCEQQIHLNQALPLKVKAWFRLLICPK